MKLHVKTLSGSEFELDAEPARKIVKSEKDPRQYQYLELENGLRVTLVSDPSAKQASAAMSVHVGSEDDPKEFQGLSHLLEHSLFLGSAKYPNRNAYTEFVKSNGGSCNAYTSSVETVYFFEVSPPSLREACEIFSRFFVDPLFDEELVKNELSAIDEEFSLARKGHCVRIDAVLRELAPADSTFQRFTIGNSQTLKGESVVAALKRHHAEYYSARNMTLVLVGSQSLKELESIVQEFFAEINSSPPPRRPAPQGCPIETGKSITVSAFTTSQRELRIVWPVPELRSLVSTQPTFYVIDMFNRFEKGSLYARLKSEGLIESISLMRDYPSRHFSLLVVAAGLTEKGFENYETVAEEVSAFLEGLDKNGIPDWFWPEFQTISRQTFDLADGRSVSQRAIHLAVSMAFVPPESLLTWSVQPDKYCPESISEIVSLLKPENSIQILTGPMPLHWSSQVEKVDLV